MLVAATAVERKQGVLVVLPVREHTVGGERHRGAKLNDRAALAVDAGSRSCPRAIITGIRDSISVRVTMERDEARL